jgi:hypothetical protein
MPGFQGTGKATLIRDNQQLFLFQQETNVTGRPSIALQLERINRSAYPWGMSFQISFTDVNGNPADPGTFEVTSRPRISISIFSTARSIHGLEAEA